MNKMLGASNSTTSKLQSGAIHRMSSAFCVPFELLVGIVADNVEDVQRRGGDLSWHEYKSFPRKIRRNQGMFTND